MKRFILASTRCLLASKSYRRISLNTLSPTRYFSCVPVRRQESKITSESIAEQISLLTAQLDDYSRERSEQLDPQQDDAKLNPNLFDETKKIDEKKLQTLVTLALNPSVYVNPIMLSNFLLNVVQYRQIQLEKKVLKERVMEAETEGKISQKKVRDMSVDDSETRKLLLRAWELLKPFVSKKTPNETLFALAMQIGAKLKTDRTIMNEAFQNYMDYFYVNYNKYQKDADAFPLQFDTIALAFSIAPHLGRYNEMLLLGNTLEVVLPEIQNDLPPIMELFHESSLATQTFDYSAIHEILKREENEKILEMQGIIKYTGPLIFATYRVHSVKIKPTNEDSFLNTDWMQEEFKTDIESDWISFDHDMPAIVQWGDCMLWYQLNGGILLSGLSLPVPNESEEDMREMIVLHGFAEYEQLTEQEQQNIIKEYGAYDEERIEFTEKEDQKEFEKDLQDSKNVPEDREYTFRVETDMKFIHDEGTRYKGKYVRTMSSELRDAVVFEKKVCFDMVMNVEKIE